MTATKSLCGSYTGTQSGGAFMLDSVLDYPLYFLVGSVFGSASAATQPDRQIITATSPPTTTPTRRCGW